MITFPNAKINLGLNIVERRADGYHNLETVFYPIGITDPHPRFSWQVKSSREGYMQQAYQIVVSQSLSGLRNGKKAIWDSGRIESDQSVLIPYDGPSLSPATTYYWTVRTWSTAGEASKWCKPQSFTTGLSEETDWHGAEWIAMEQDRRTQVPGIHIAGAARHILGNIRLGDYAQPQFRKNYTAVEKIRRATAFVCGLGHFDFFLNGKKVGNHFLDAGWTLYNREALYVGFDVTECLRKGENVIGVMLGNGFYNVPYDLERYFKLLTSFGAPKMRFLLQVEYASGRKEYVVSDPSWKVAESPFTFSSIYGGEDYDAQRQLPGWLEPGYDDSAWQKAQQTKCDILLRAQLCEPVTVRREIPTDRISRASFGSGFGLKIAGRLSSVRPNSLTPTVRLISRPPEPLIISPIPRRASQAQSPGNRSSRTMDSDM